MVAGTVVRSAAESSRFLFRPAGLRDSSRLVGIDCELFPHSGGDHFRQHGLRGFSGYVAELNQEIIGYVVYAFRPETQCIDIWSLGVLTPHRRNHVGSALVKHVCYELPAWNQLYAMPNASLKCVRAVVSARNLAAQQFFRSQQFRGWPGASVSGHEAIRFEWRPQVPAGSWKGVNRISRVFLSDNVYHTG